jgi:hypothetical protein
MLIASGWYVLPSGADAMTSRVHKEPSTCSSCTISDCDSTLCRTDKPWRMISTEPAKQAAISPLAATSSSRLSPRSGLEKVRLKVRLMTTPPADSGLHGIELAHPADRC